MILHDLTTRLSEVKDGLNKPIFLKLARGILYTALAFHFSVLALHQLPENPLQHQLKYKLHRYVDPFFSQAWTLFAPTPINTNMSLLLRFQYDNANGEQVSDWIDITEPLIQDRLDNFWSPAQRISKFTQSSMSNVNENHKLALAKIAEIDSLAQDSVKSKAFYHQAMGTTYGYRSILQYGGYIAKNYFRDKGIRPSEVKMQYRILNARFPRFSKRKEDYHDLSNYEFSELTSDFLTIQYHQHYDTVK